MSLLTRIKWENTRWAGGDVVAPAKPPIEARSPEPRPEPTRESYLVEYAELAQLVGIAAPDLGVELFKQYLRQKDWGLFALADVITYMDAKAAAESQDKAGWEWRPLREKDNRGDLQFGRAANHYHFTGENPQITPASDFYRGPHRQIAGYHGGSRTEPHYAVHPASSTPYDKTIPLHALRKVAAIEREYTGDVALFVCDYAPLPAIQYPDPFLMAVVPNSNARLGVGRFIIDFWDEPNFGVL